MPRGLARLYAWISGAWQRQPILLGYSSLKTERLRHTKSGDGFKGVDSASVDEGEIWVLEAMDCLDEDSSITAIEIWLIGDGGSVYTRLAVDYAPVADQSLVWSGQITMLENDSIRFNFYDAVDGDQLTCQYTARIIDIDQ